MFTGIISDLAELKSINKIKDLRYRFFIKKGFNKVNIGSSICCNGVCLTLVKKDNNCFEVDISNETLSLTNLSFIKVGDIINIEKSLRIGDELSGHFVTGHIDGLGELSEIIKINGSYKISITTDNNIISMIAKKGSVSIDGISLTVNDVINNNFIVNIIPHTWDNTNLSKRNLGDKLNIEIDIISRYVKNSLKTISN